MVGLNAGGHSSSEHNQDHVQQCLSLWRSPTFPLLFGPTPRLTLRLVLLCRQAPCKLCWTPSQSSLPLHIPVQTNTHQWELTNNKVIVSSAFVWHFPSSSSPPLSTCRSSIGQEFALEHLKHTKAYIWHNLPEVVLESCPMEANAVYDSYRQWVAINPLKRVNYSY